MQFFTIIVFLISCSFSFSEGIDVTQDIKVEYPRIYFPNPNSSSYQDSFCRKKAPLPLISGEAFRELAHHKLDTRGRVFNPDLVKSGDIIFVDEVFLTVFIKKIFPKISNSFFLITATGPCAGRRRPIPGQYKDILEDKKIIKWYSKNTDLINHPKLVVIPLGIRWFNMKKDISSNLALLKKELTSVENNFKAKKKYLCTSIFRFQTCAQRRKPCIEYVLNHKDFIKNFPYLPFTEYVDILKSSYFVISPPGLSIDCFRHWESMICGAYPIMLRSTIDEVFKDLPVVLIDSWEEVTKKFLLAKLKEFSKKQFNLKKLNFQYWRDLILSDRANYLNSHPGDSSCDRRVL